MIKGRNWIKCWFLLKAAHSRTQNILHTSLPFPYIFKYMHMFILRNDMFYFKNLLEACLLSSGFYSEQELTDVVICWNGGVVGLKPSRCVSWIAVKANAHQVWRWRVRAKGTGTNSPKKWRRVWGPIIDFNVVILAPAALHPEKQASAPVRVFQKLGLTWWKPSALEVFGAEVLFIVHVVASRKHLTDPICSSLPNAGRHSSSWENVSNILSNSSSKFWLCYLPGESMIYLLNISKCEHNTEIILYLYFPHTVSVVWIISRVVWALQHPRGIWN